MIKKLLDLFKTNKKSANKVPTILQMEAVECGAASLSMILASYGRWVPLEEMRVECDVTRDGSKASNLLKAARRYGLKAKGFRLEPRNIKEHRLPAIVHWNFVHYAVLEKIDDEKAYLVDPALGPNVVSLKEFDEAFTGVFLEFEVGEDFKKGGQKPKLWPSLKKRLTSSWSALSYIMLASIVLIFPGIVIPGFSKIFIDKVLVENMSSWIVPLLWGLILTAILRVCFTFVQQYYLVRLQEKLSLKTSAEFIWHTLKLPVNFFFQRGVGDVSSRIQSNDKVAKLLAGDLGTNVANLLSILFYFIVMCLFSFKLALISIFFTAINVIVMISIAKKRKDASHKMAKDYSKLMGTLMSGLMMIETFKSMGGEADFFKRLSGYQAKFLNTQHQMSIMTEPLSILPTLLSALTTAFVLGIGGYEILAGSLTIGSLVAFQSLLASFNQPIAGLLKAGEKIQEVSADLQRLDDILNHPISTRYDIGNRLERKDLEHSKLTGEIEYRNIFFGYSLYSEPLIKDFNLKVKPGTRVALVGGSGSGKSTLAKLINGHYQPKSGKIYLDGIELNKVPLNVLSISMASVDQDVFLFNGSIKENLTMWDNSILEKDIIQAAKDACIHDVIVSRTSGYDGILSEGGSDLSGGQRQRLEIARALTLNPSILILDEATSALDPITEKEIDNNLRRRGCTCLIIAHRLSTIRDCDEIIVLDKGVVKQRGTHDELMADENGAYASMLAAES